MKKILLPAFISLFASFSYAQKATDTSSVLSDSAIDAINNYLQFADSLNSALKYEKGTIMLKGGFATLHIPDGFKFLNAEQSQFVVHEAWGNPEDKGVLGMIFPDSSTPFSDSSYAFVITFDDMGYVKDDDAKDINYDDLLKEIQDGEADENKERLSQGYPSIHLTGWAQKPFYDDKRKVLHWAKELEFGDNKEDHTLNYDVRVLGRKGVLSLNAVASMSEMELVKRDIDKVLAMASFTDGNAYADFDSNTDKIAAYTIGGLVAGKILAKVGFWALIVKFWKLIAAGVVAAFYAVRKWLTGKGRKEELAVQTTGDNDETTQPS